MAARHSRPPPQPSGGRDPALAEMTKEEKEEMLNRKMEEIKRKNEAIKRRHEEVEADKRYAEELMQKQRGPVDDDSDDGMAHRSPSSKKEMKGQINEERKKRPLSMDATNTKPRLSTGRGRRLEKMAATKEKPRPQDAPVMRHNNDSPRQEAMRRRERPKSEGWFDQQKIQEAGKVYERNSNSKGPAFDRSNSRPDQPNSRRDTGSGRFDRSNSRNDSNLEYRQNAGMRNGGGPDNRSNSRPDPRRNEKESHNSPQDRSGPPRQRGGKREPEQEQNPDGPPPDPSFNFLADRSRDPSKAEPRDVTRRHPGNFGGVSFGNVRKQIQHDKQRGGRGGGRGPPQSKLELTMRMTGRERQQYLQWKKERESIDEARIQRQQDPEGDWRREWDHDKVEQFGGKTEPARRPGSPSRGASANRGTGRGRGRGGSQGPPPNRTRAFSSGSDDGSRSVAKQDDKLFIKIENEYAYRKKSGGQSPGELKSPGSGVPLSPGLKSPNQKVSPGERTRPVPARGPSGRTSAPNPPKGRGAALKARSESQKNSVGRGSPVDSDDTYVTVIIEDNPPPPRPKRDNQKKRSQQKNVQRSNSQKESQKPQAPTPEQKQNVSQEQQISPKKTGSGDQQRRVSPQPGREKTPPKKMIEENVKLVGNEAGVVVENETAVPVPESAGAAMGWEKEEPNPDLYGVQMDEEELRSYQTYLQECREKGDKFLEEYEDDLEEIDYDQYRLKLDVDLCGVVPVSVSSPTSDASIDSSTPFMLKTPTGHVKVIDWAAEMDNTYQDSRSSNALDSLNSTNSFAEDLAEGRGVQGDNLNQDRAEDDGAQDGDVQVEEEAPEGDGHYDDGEDDNEEVVEGLEAGVLYDGLEGGEYYVDEEDEEGAEDGDDEFEDAVDDGDEYYEDEGNEVAGEAEVERGEVEDKGEVQEGKGEEEVEKGKAEDEGEEEGKGEMQEGKGEEDKGEELGKGEEQEKGEKKDEAKEEVISRDVTNEVLPAADAQADVVKTHLEEQEKTADPPVPEAGPEGSSASKKSPEASAVCECPDEPDTYPDCDQPEEPLPCDAPPSAEIEPGPAKEDVQPEADDTLKDN